MTISRKILITSIAASVLICTASIYYARTETLETARQAGTGEDAGTTTLGGTTPAEALAGFLQALKNEDVQTAARYFALDADGSRDRRITWLKDLSTRNLISTMLYDITTLAKPSPANTPGADVFSYDIKSPDGGLSVVMTLRKDASNGLWSIIQF